VQATASSSTALVAAATLLAFLTAASFAACAHKLRCATRGARRAELAVTRCIAAFFEFGLDFSYFLSIGHLALSFPNSSWCWRIGNFFVYNFT